MAEKPKVTVMMNGILGAMGQEVSKACLRRGFGLAPVAMEGPGTSSRTAEVTDDGGATHTVRCVGSDEPAKQKEAVEAAQKEFGSALICIDFTHPTAVNPNSRIYAETKVPFVMGTTGGDREELMQVTEGSGGYAVVAPNMCKQIVAFQATMERTAREFPGAFSGYKLDLVESHQSTKADTSGTARAMVGFFNTLGVEPFDDAQIRMLRKRDEQTAFGVPEHALNGHAFHTYTLSSPDGSVKFQFQHNVSGRSTYAEGVADAVTFLASKMAQGSEKKVFNMIDVLSEGAMS